MGAGWSAQALPAGLALVTLALLATRVLRADGIAVLALAVAVATGVVPADRALAGFSDPVVVTVGALSVLAAAVHRSGIVDLPRSALARRWRLTAPVLLTGGVLVALLAAISGRVGTRDAVLRASRLGDAAEGTRLPFTLLNLACLLGGTMTVVGGVPNLLVSAMRADQLGAPFDVLQFLPVGAALLGSGLVMFLVGTVLRRQAETSRSINPTDQLRRVKSFTTEVVVPPGSVLAGRPVAAVEAVGDNSFRVRAMVREGFRRIEARPDWPLLAGDVLVLDCDPADLHRLIERFGLQPADGPLMRLGSATGVTLVEAVVTQSSELIGTPPARAMLGASGVHLLGIGRNDDHLAGRLRRTPLRAGDILVLAAETESVPQLLAGLGCLLLAERRLRLGKRRLAVLPLGVLLLALGAAAFGILPLWLATLSGVLALVLLGVLTLSETYEIVPWPGMVMLASLLPLAAGLYQSPVALALADVLTPVVAASPAAWVIAAVILVAMGAGVLFGSAVCVLLLMPFVLAVATASGLSADGLLMAVAVGSSVDMLDERGLVAALVPLSGRRRSPGWRIGLLAAAAVLVCGTAAIAGIWGA